MARHKISATLLCLASVALLLATAPSAYAAGRAARSTPAGTPATASCTVLALPAASAGLRIQIDPLTGTLSMPEAIEPAPAGNSLLPPRESMPVQVLPNGTLTVRLDDRFMEYAVIRLGVAGAPQFECVQGRDAAGRLLFVPGIVASPAPAAPAKEVLR